MVNITQFRDKVNEALKELQGVPKEEQTIAEEPSFEQRHEEVLQKSYEGRVLNEGYNRTF